MDLERIRCYNKDWNQHRALGNSEVKIQIAQEEENLTSSSAIGFLRRTLFQGESEFILV
jgi:hypothetical protein